MEKALLHIVSVRVVADYKLDLEFDDGSRKTVDLRPKLTGPIFAPLKDPSYFRRVGIDPVA